MITIKQMARNRWVMIGVILILALYYFLIFKPLSESAETLDKPLNTIWQELADFSLESSSVRDLDLDEIRKTRGTLGTSLKTTLNFRNEISARVDWEAEIRAKMNEPFLLIDFQNDRQKRIEQLMELAKTQQVILDASVFAGFPEYRAETRDAGILWAQLAMVDHILTVAINSKAQRIKTISFISAPMDGTNMTKSHWQEIQLRIELIAPMPDAAKFLSAMPLRAEEIKSAGLPESLPGKPALFLDRVMMQKQSPEKLDEISLDAVISGFVAGTRGQVNRQPGKGALL